ncbi:hypothetical protein [Vampirovibrio sp.]|uniref:hypothetical protein n=1 Tax=Vampirovibrio sp. TaxID=2717857 RepID=UPI00359490E7
MSIQSTTRFNPLITQPGFANPTIDSGTQAGGVFNGRGNDFLDPRDILSSVNGFSQSITPTSGTLNNGFSSSFGGNFLTPSASLNQDLANFNPLIWTDPSATNVLIGTMDATNKIFGGNGLFQPNLVPPLFPAITRSQPPFNNFVTPVLQQAQLFPQTFLSGSPLFQPVSGVSNTSQNGFIRLQLQGQLQLLQQDINALETQRARVLQLDQTGDEDKNRVQEQAVTLQTQINQKKAQLQSTQQAILQLQAQPQQNTVVVASNGFSTNGLNNGQPFAVSGTAVVFPFQSQVALMGQLFNQQQGAVSAPSGGIVSGQINGVAVNQLTSANGVPAWIA